MGLFDYIKDLPEQIIMQLYGNYQDPSSNSQWACKAMFQSLTPLSRNVVMRLIFVDEFSLPDLSGWVHLKDKHSLDASIEELLRLHIIVKSRSGPFAYMIDNGFRKSLQDSLCSSSGPWSDIPCDEQTDDKPSIMELENICISKWNATLEYLVTSRSDISITPAMKVFLLRAGLMQQLENDTPSITMKENSKSELCITSKGYEYMLLDIQEQVWIIVLQCLLNVPTPDTAEVISFLFMLSYCKVGDSYPVRALSRAQYKFMLQLSDLGVIFRTHAKSTVFYPTRIAVSMCSTSDQVQTIPTVAAISIASGGMIPVEEAASHSEAMHIIVETNFQVVAYLTSDLHLHMLRLFVENHGMVRLPNMVVGHLTRGSVKGALRLGISAAQIVSFLEVHAHPLVAHKVPIVPENVTDQLFLWEAENDRIRSNEGIFVNLSEIASGEYLDVLFAQMVEYAHEIGVCLWSSEEKKSLVVTPEGYNQLNAFAESLE